MVFVSIITLLFCIVSSTIYYLSEHGLIAKTQRYKPWVYSLSLGGFAGMWAIFGTLHLAEENGFIYLSYFLGTSGVFILAPLLLTPLASLAQTYHLYSLADLLSFRYNSQLAGIIVTIASLLGVLPLMAMQLLTLGQASHLLFADMPSPQYLTTFTVIITSISIAAFSLVSLRRKINAKDQHQGLAFTLAILSIFKLLIFIGIATFCIFTLFGSFSQLEHWLYIQPDKLMVLNESQHTNHARSLLLIFFAATLAMPHMFLLTFNERATPEAIKQSSWLFPSYLLLLSLPALPFIWMKELTELNITAQLIPFALGHILNSPIITLLMYLAALAAITSSMAVICLSIAAMFNSHIILPLFLKSKKYSITDNSQVFFQAFIICSTLTLATFAAIGAGELKNLNQFGFASYTAILQFLPGILAVIYWSKANRAGLHYSLAVGLGIWFITTALPLISQDAWGLRPWLQQLFLFDHDNYWFLAAISALGLNMLTLGFVSVISRTGDDQQYIAKVCSQNEIGKPIKRRLLVENTTEIMRNLSHELGEVQATELVTSALTALNMHIEEQRPFALRLLRRQIESSLSGLYGPTVARRIVARHLPYAKSSSKLEDQQIIEFRLERAKNNLSGLAGELDGMRRRHQKTIEQLPIGVCTFSSDQEIIIWNSSLATATQIASSIATGLTLDKLPEPWKSVFESFIHTKEMHCFKKEISVGKQSYWFNLHKGNNDDDNIHTILVEDVTQLAKLENEWSHHERLATIGRLAAGVAHEIGNPVTGIACLAQNLKYDSDNPDVDASAKDILIQTDRITNIVQSLVNFSHAGNHSESNNRLLSSVLLKQCLNEAIQLLALKDRSILTMIDNQLPHKLSVQADMQGLQQVFLNLLQNAVQACQQTPQATIRISADIDEFTLNLNIQDNGPGIPENLQNTIFEPFVTTKGSEEGTGLGLAIVYSIVEEHHGEITVQSPAPGEVNGSLFTIRLPLN